MESAFNLARAAGTLASSTLGKERTGTIRRKLIQIPARGPETRPAPPGQLALGNRLNSPVRGGLRPATNGHHPTTQPNGATRLETLPAARPTAPPCPPPETSDQTPVTRLSHADRWIEA